MLKKFLDSQFATEIKKEEISIIKFSAEWCGPCKSLAPILETISDEYSDKAFGWYAADVESDAINTASAMGIRGVPTTIIYRAGEEVDRLIGNPGEQAVRAFISKHI